MITINDIDTTYLQLNGDTSELEELRQAFSFKIAGIEHTYKYKAGLTDGKKYLISKGYRILYGLKSKVISYCQSNSIECIDNTADIREDIDQEFKEFINNVSNELSFKLYPHQLKGVYLSLKNKRLTLLSATGSGKSAIIYCILRWSLYKNIKSLLIVPSVSLTEQMYSDFLDYFNTKESSLLKKLEETEDIYERTSIQSELEKIYESRKKTNCLSIEENFTTISAGKDKETSHPSKISTYQSLSISESEDMKHYRIDKENYKNIGMLIIDECHQSESNSISSILSECSNSQYKIGLSGSLKQDLLSNYIIEGLIGKVEKIVTMRELIDLGLATEIVIKPLLLKYDNSIVSQVRKLNYQEQDKFLRNYEPKNEFIAKLANSFSDKNVMVIYKNIDSADSIISNHLNIRGSSLLPKDCTKENKEKIYYSKGSTNPKNREKFRKLLEKSTGNVLYGTSSIIATGINIKNLHVIIFAMIGKSSTLVIQGLGRSARLHESKKQSLIYDLVDDCRHFTRSGNEKQNYSYKHFIERVNIYNLHEYYVDDPKNIQITKKEIY